MLNHVLLNIMKYIFQRIRSAWTYGWEKMQIIWPKNNLRVQLWVFFCIFTLVATRFVKLLVPIFNQKVGKFIDIFTLFSKQNSNILNIIFSCNLVDSLEEKIFCWDLIALYVLFDFLNNFLNTCQNVLWTPIEQYTSKQIQIKLFSHLHNLSLRWHHGRKTGEVLQTMNGGSRSINMLLKYILQVFLPAIFDIIVSVVFLSIMFNWYFGVLVIIAMCLYSRQYYFTYV